ncbi:hypothetical protein VTI74DRAFT_9792 [Chaetomium olivicolor]
MAFSWETIYSFFTPPASRNTSPSLFSSPFFSSSNKSTDSTSQTTTTNQAGLPMPPTSALGAYALPSPVESASAVATTPNSETDYFPPYPGATHRSPSMSSTSTASTTLSQQQQQHQRTTTTANTESDRPSVPRRSAAHVVALDTMSRSFPKPAHEPSLDELLARKPPKWSLGHYVKNARVRADVAAEQQQQEEERARKFEEAKRELLRAKEEIERLAGAGRR